MREILFFKGILIFLTSPQYFRLTATILSGPNSGVPENEKLSFTEVTEKVFLSGEMGNMYREVTVKKTAKEQARWIQKGVKVTELRYGKAGTDGSLKSYRFPFSTSFYCGYEHVL